MLNKNKKPISSGSALIICISGGHLLKLHRNRSKYRMSGGERGIRTLDTDEPYTGFRVRRIRPLCHLSARILNYIKRKWNFSMVCRTSYYALRCLSHDKWRVYTHLHVNYLRWLKYRRAFPLLKRIWWYLFYVWIQFLKEWSSWISKKLLNVTKKLIIVLV